MSEKNDLMEKIVSLCKRRGFIFQGSEIYGGLAGTWDWGHFGVALKNNIKQNWWKKIVDGRKDMYGVDAAILMRQEVWQASGHVAGFADPMVECEECHSKFRADTLITDQSDFDSIKRYVSEYILNKYFKNTEGSLQDIKKDLSMITELEKKPITEKEKESLNSALDPIREIIKNKIDSVEKDLEKIRIIKEELNKSDKYTGWITQLYLNREVLCPEKSCRAHGKWSVPSPFNMMFKTYVGATEDSNSVSYLRPETAQGMFVNFKNTVDAFHPKLPFGLAQIGKAFRNEIAPRDFVFRSREFEQMEIEYFVRVNEWEKYFEYWKGEMLEWMEEIGIDMSKVHELEVPKEDRAHYSSRTVDFEFDFPFGKKELFGLAYRTDFDLKNHKLEYIDEEAGEKMVPHVIEPTFGVDRAVLTVLLSAYHEEEKDGEVRSYLKFKPSIAPVICAVSPLLKNKPELVEYANEKVYAPLKLEFGRVAWDDNGNIGKRYRRQDEIGTPFCIVVDFDTLGDNAVTVRDRDTGEQERIKVEDLKNYIKERIS